MHAYESNNEYGHYLLESNMLM